MELGALGNVFGQQINFLSDQKWQVASGNGVRTQNIKQILATEVFLQEGQSAWQIVLSRRVVVTKKRTGCVAASGSPGYGVDRGAPAIKGFIALDLRDQRKRRTVAGSGVTFHVSSPPSYSQEKPLGDREKFGPHGVSPE